MYDFNYNSISVLGICDIMVSIFGEEVESIKDIILRLNYFFLDLFMNQNLTLMEESKVLHRKIQKRLSHPKETLFVFCKSEDKF
jgi:hypothetical protein